MASEIHPTAIIEDGAVIGAGCRIGPYCVLGAEVALGEGVELHAHVVIAGHTRIGAGTRIWPFASIGHQPQDLKYRGERTTLEIGAKNMIREHVTMSPGTGDGGGVTRVGDGNLFMVGVHVAHDCLIGSGNVFANQATLAGHVVVEDHVVAGGLSAVQQFCRIGRGAMIGGMSGITADVVPYGLTMGNRAHLAGLNLVGLKRRGVDRADLAALRAAFERFFQGEGSIQERVAAEAQAAADNPLIADIARFVAAEPSRHYVLPQPGRRGDV